MKSGVKGFLLLLLVPLMLVCTFACSSSASKAEVHTVTFVCEGAVIPAMQAPEGSTFTAPASPVRAGYVFAGWYADTAYAAAWNFANDTVVADMTLYGKWTTIATPSPTAPPVATATATPTAEPTHKPTHEPTHEPTREPAPVHTPKPTFTVIFNSNGGSTVPPEINIPYDSKIARPHDPGRAGYIFLGWYRNSALTQAWEFSEDRVHRDLTLYARWEEEYVEPTHTVRFESNGGSHVSSYRDIPYGSTIPCPPDPGRAGYRFIGWYRHSRPWLFDNDIVTANITLEAMWEATEITIRFDPNGGTPQPLDKTVPAGDSVTLPSNLVRPGYSLAGWYTAKEGGSNLGNGGDSYTPSASVTIYAQWINLSPVPK